jgi:porin
MNFGIGGQSPFHGRENDLFGIGWFYNEFSDELGPIATTALGIGSSAQGVEIYYNYTVTPYFRLTPDLQIVEPAIEVGTTALILGLRAQLSF